MTIHLIAGLTVDEFLDRGLDECFELLGGETRPKPLPDFDHSGMEKCLLDQFFSGDRVLHSLDVR